MQCMKSSNVVKMYNNDFNNNLLTEQIPNLVDVTFTV